ncbi:MAG TPA: NFACT RNA binding domain-containing protein [Candidatus Aquilonibacter sp.]|nr:NFACT RNA binding domain-containing protein [Candidatus Aquilonibacter sp.]
MRTDPALIRRAAHELDERFRGSRVTDVGRLPDGRVALALHRRGTTMLVCFDIFGSPPLLTVEDGELPIAAEPGFVRAVGAALRGTTFLDAQSRTGDRVLRLRFGTRSRFGVGDEIALYVELVPRFGNLVLVKRDVIVAALKEFSLAENGMRAVEAGLTYELPPLVARGAGDVTAIPEDASVLDAFAADRNERIGTGDRARTAQRRASLLKRLSQRERKLRDERDKVEAKRSKARAREALRDEGEAIFATLHERADHEREEAKTQAAALFAQYKKLGTSLPHLEERLAAIDAGLQAVEELRWEAERTHDAELSDVERAIDVLEGRQRQPRGTARARKRDPLEVRTQSGSRILIGRSPTENAELTFRVARPNDLWFHAQNIPGAHVILQRDDRAEPPGDDLLRAASLAAFYSKARESTKVPIDYTERKHVRAQRDAPPGLVWYTNPRTLIVEPNAS